MLGKLYNLNMCFIFIKIVLQPRIIGIKVADAIDEVFAQMIKGLINIENVNIIEAQLPVFE
ncbi:MAG: hypothetical protein ACOYIF_07975 [Acetivibrionales bacterium]